MMVNNAYKYSFITVSHLSWKEKKNPMHIHWVIGDLDISEFNTNI